MTERGDSRATDDDEQSDIGNEVDAEEETDAEPDAEGETDAEPDDDHLDDVEDGAGCTEIWERLSERRGE